MLYYNGIPFRGFVELQAYVDTVGGRLMRISRACAYVDIKSIVPPTPDMRFVPMRKSALVNGMETVISLLLPPQVRAQVTRILFTEGQQVSQLNYGNFIHVMAEMIQKYAPKILEAKEDVS